MPKIHQMISVRACRLLKGDNYRIAWSNNRSIEATFIELEGDSVAKFSNKDGTILEVFKSSDEMDRGWFANIKGKERRVFFATNMAGAERIRASEVK